MLGVSNVQFWMSGCLLSMSTHLLGNRGANLGESAVRSLLDWASRAGEEPRGFPCLRKLSLCENGIRLEGEEYETIRSLPLEHLDLSENALLGESMRGFSRILPVTLKVG
jgi:hypothetical protein